jgi:O-antigen/teichoic acid export membrane protein
MFVSLFTSRIILQTLGVTDFGINNVVAGVVALFGFLSGTLMGITQRFITVELGKGNQEKLQKIFSTSMILHLAVGVIVLILAETIGLWFLNNKLVIPAERMVAANWVYQFAVFSFLLSLFNAPLTALIVSHEDMHVYGYMGIFDVVVRLVMVYLLVMINADKLIFWAIFGFGVSCIVTLIYFVYCRKKYQEARFSFTYDKSLLKELSGFGGYVFGANIFGILRMQGTNIMLNMFFGPTVNAAVGLANSVNTALLSFGNNFRQALIPQITKYYAQNEKEQTWSLVERGTRFSHFLFLVFCIPFLLEAEFVLKLWLKDVPKYTAIFVKLMVVHILVVGPIGILGVVVNASGRLRAWYVTTYLTTAVVLLISYFYCKMGYAPYYVFIALLVMSLLNIPVHFLIMKKQFDFSVSFFTKRALIPMFFVTALSFLPFYFVSKLLSKSFFSSLIVMVTSMLWTGVVIIVVGIRKNERAKFIDFIKRKMFFSLALANGK